MKKRLVSLLLAFSMMLTFLPAIPISAAAGQNTTTIVTIDGCTYTLDEATHKATVTHYAPTRNSSSSKRAFEILSKVTKEGDSTPYTVTAIGKNAFANVESNTAYDVNDILTGITIPDTITEIGEYAFWGCQGLTKIQIPASVKTIGNYAFYNCTNLQKIVFPEGVTQIGVSVVGYNTKYTSFLTEVVVPSTIDNSGNNSGMDTSFSGASLTTVTLTSGLEIIDSRAFKNCKNLKQINIPASVKQIRDNAFNGSGLESLDFKGSSEISSFAFKNCESLKDVTVECRWLGTSAFEGCAVLTKVVLSSNVKTIQNNAFRDCTNLSDVKYNGYKNDWDAVWTNYSSSKSGNETLIDKAQYLCDINFDLNGGTINGSDAIAKQTVYSKEKLSEANCYDSKQNDKAFVIPADPVREGCTFTGWYKEGESTPVTSLAEYAADDNVTFTAGWAKTYKVTFDGNANGDTVTGIPDEQVVNENANATSPNTEPQRIGYDFDGWYATADGNRKYTFTEAVNADTTLYAHWKAHNYNVTLDNDGNKETNPYDYGATVTVPTPAKKSGYNFNSWDVTVPEGKTAPALNGPDADGKYSFTMPDNEVTLTAKWTQKDVIDPDVDLKFDPATGEVTSNNPNVKDSDIVNKKVYDENGNEVPSDKLNEKGLPTEPGDYIIKVDVKETDATAPADQITGNQPQWKYNVPKKEKPSDNTDKDNHGKDDPTPKRKLDVADGTITKVVDKDGKDITDTITKDADGKYEIPTGATVTITAKDAPEGMKFGEWTISDKNLLGDPDVPYTEKDLTFTMPDNKDGVSVSVVYLEESIGEEPNLLEKGAVAGTVIVGSAALLYQGHMLGTELYLRYLLPHGAIIPQNRAELAVLLWQDAGNPEPVSTALYSDISDEDSAIQQAARWAVENDLLELLDEGEHADHFDPFVPVTFTDSIHAWKKAQELKK